MPNVTAVRTRGSVDAVIKCMLILFYYIRPKTMVGGSATKEQNPTHIHTTAAGVSSRATPFNVRLAGRPTPAISAVVS